MRYGYNTFHETTFKCTNSDGIKMKGEPFKRGDTVYMMVHKGSYSNFEKTKAKVSYFLKKADKKKMLYLFTFCNIPLPSGEKLYGFVSTYKSDVSIRIGRPIYRYSLPQILTKIEF